ncbi:transcriptional activator RinB [Staphylococcus capitis]|uniref:transcriptional activator RinB n=1 Tax=Staphylococcus devriesei TaxID=586733 RepID=UPI000CD25765|nr:transcriptional regulator [Staphylococcus devriesei]PNZ88651.1 transcriptional regulator [Staphylococcus devriesei]SUM04144.1 phage transcriptional activator RinB [Staphylococcus devriesei]
MIKHISKLIFTLAMYELGKYITNQILIKMQANDDVDVSSDYARESDQYDINDLAGGY